MGDHDVGFVGPHARDDGVRALDAGALEHGAVKAHTAYAPAGKIGAEGVERGLVLVDGGYGESLMDEALGKARAHKADAYDDDVHKGLLPIDGA